LPSLAMTPFHRLFPSSFFAATQNDSIRYGERPLHCGIAIRPMTANGMVRNRANITGSVRRNPAATASSTAGCKPVEMSAASYLSRKLRREQSGYAGYWEGWRGNVISSRL